MMLLGVASTGDIQQHYKSLIFVGGFFLIMVATLVWWLKR